MTIPECDSIKPSYWDRCPAHLYRCVTKSKDGWFDTWTKAGLWWLFEKGAIRPVEIRVFPDALGYNDDGELVPDSIRMYDMGWDCEDTPFRPDSWWKKIVIPPPPF